MSLKRKFVLDGDEDLSPASSKQPKIDVLPELVDSDVAMSDAPSSTEPSPTASCSPLPSPHYPTFHLYPQTPSEEYGYQLPPTPSTPEAVGLMQPSSFSHNKGNCTQIPKLRVSCESGPGGPRTMWSFCEECGAIALIT